MGLLVPCVLIALPAALAWRAESQLTGAFQWVSHTLEVERELQRLAALLVDAETGQRGYLLSSRAEFLDPYRAALTKIPVEITHLGSLTSDNPIQQENLRLLRPLVQGKLGFMADNVALQAAGQHEEALHQVETGRGQEAMNSLRTRIDAMYQEENRLLSLREKALDHQTRVHALLTYGSAGLSALFAAAVLAMYRRQARAKRLIIMCAWSRTVEYEGEWLSFEEYLRRRFAIDTTHGISPAEAEKSLRALRESRD